MIFLIFTKLLKKYPLFSSKDCWSWQGRQFCDYIKLGQLYSHIGNRADYTSITMIIDEVLSKYYQNTETQWEDYWTQSSEVYQECQDDWTYANQ